MEVAPGEWVQAIGHAEWIEEDEKALIERAVRREAAKEGWDEERVQREIENAMIDARRFRLRVAETKALLRAIRAILSLKTSYTLEELSKPFVIVSWRRILSPVDLEERWREVFGEPNERQTIKVVEVTDGFLGDSVDSRQYLICGPREALTISQLYLNVVRPTEMGTVPYGAFVERIITPYGELQVVISPDMAPETRTIGASSVQASDIIILDTDQPVAGGAGLMPGTAIEVHELLPMEAWIFPMQTTLTTPVVVWEVLTLAVRAENFQAKIINIGPSS